MIRGPPRIESIVDASTEWFTGNISPDEAATGISNHYSTNIQHFVDRQRQQFDLGGLQQRRTQMTAPGIQVDYTMNAGAETIRMTYFPESAPEESLGLNAGSDQNLDGYLAFKKFGGPLSSGVKIKFFLNDTQIGPSYLTGSQNHEIILFAFGKTAMRCRSLSDQFNPNFPKNILNPISPPRGTISAAENSDGLPIPAHLDLLGYFAYDWWNPVNYASYYPDENALPSPFNEFDITTNPPVVLELDFLDVTKTAFKSSGPNTFRVNISPQEEPGDSIAAVYELFGEFYDRNAKRPVDTSWRLSGGGIVVNDKPLWWDVQYVINGYVEEYDLTLDFDPAMKADDVTAATTQVQNVIAYENNSLDYSSALIIGTDELPVPLPPWKKGDFPIRKAPAVTDITYSGGSYPVYNPAPTETLEEAWAAVSALFETTSAYAVGYVLVDTPLSVVPTANATILYVYDEQHAFWVPAG